MIGTFVTRDESSITHDAMVAELARDFGIRPTYSYSDLTSYFSDLLKSYQMKNLQTMHELCNYLHKHTTQSVSTDLHNESIQSVVSVSESLLKLKSNQNSQQQLIGGSYIQDYYVSEKSNMVDKQDSLARESLNRDV